MVDYKTIRITNKTYEALASQGTLKDSFDSVIQNLIIKTKQEIKST
jgi:predicted CopG family antitoxin